MSVKIFNKSSNRFNNVQSAIKNGILEHPELFELPEKKLFIKTKKGYDIVNYTSARKFKENEFYPEINKNYLYNIETGRAYIKTEKNILKIKIINKQKRRLDRKQTYLNNIKSKSEIINIEKEMDEFNKKKEWFASFSALTLLYKRLKKYINKPVTVLYIVDGEIIEYHNYFNIPENFSFWWKQITSEYHWFRESGLTIFNFHDNRGDIYILEQTEVITDKIIQQAFAEGVNNCLLTPIKNWCDNVINTCKQRRTKYKYQKKKIEINTLIDKYANGVPESDIDEIANQLQIDISIELPFNINKFIEVKSNKKALNKFKFINSKLNHVDNINCNINNIVYITSDEITDIKKKLDNNNEFYMYKLNTHSITSILTIEKNYMVKSEINQIITEFELNTGLINCKIDAIANKDLSDFIRAGCHYNSTIDFININSYKMGYNKQGESVLKKSPININMDFKHIDMKAAYSQFKKCIFYEGFLGKITDFRACNKIIEVGLYKIDNLNFSNCNQTFKKYSDRLNIYTNGLIYPSPELKMLESYGVTFNILGGCWGVKPIFFEFPDNMMKKDDVTKMSGFSKFAGMSNSIITRSTFYLNGDDKYAEMLKAHSNPQTTVYIDANNKITVQYPKKTCFHLSHITAFLTMYQRLNVIEQLMSLDYDKIIRVCVDGVYTYQDNIKLCNAFVFKNNKDWTFENDQSTSYISKFYNYYKPFYEAREHYRKQLHLGAGGCGKTHFNLMDNGLINMCYISPTHKLAVNKNEEYNIHTSVWARAFTKDIERINYIKKYYNVLVIDEVSMMTNHMKKTIFKLYPDMKLIFCGDLGYQIGPIEGVEMTIKGFNNIYHHVNNNRCKCEKLNELLFNIREMMDTHTPIKNYVINYMKKYSNITNNINYDIYDMILTSTNINKNKFTDKYAGTFNTEKYYVTENTREYQNGIIIIGDKPNVKCDVRHAFTVHSIQGETAKHKLFIDMNKMWSDRVLYTALSRAQYIKQITLIK